MRWMEFIKVQTADSIIGANLLSLLEGCTQCHGLVEARIFRHASMDDCSLCLRWDTAEPELQGSSVGTFLSTSLRKFGLVDHSVWVEQEERREGKP